MPTAERLLGARTEDLMFEDRRALRRRVDQLRRLSDPEHRAKQVLRIGADIEAAEARVARRRAAVPAIHYPIDLPVSARAGEISRALLDQQVLIVAGETGSGKTTQIPKICLEAGRGLRGLIGHTQPRRIAARAVAERIAEETGSILGGAIGYAVRFTDKVGPETLVKVMTDGILLAEIRRDRLLGRYDTLIIDEAHERSLNIDFLLGYIKQLLPRRPDLKVIVTSATIDTERFSAHFGGARIIEVSGRNFPVEIRYDPVVDEASDTGRDQTQAVCDAVADLCGQGAGDILVFASGEREIRDNADALAKAGLGDIEILPLYSRLSAAEQHRVFASHTRRRVVLATNVAETSLTVPGIRYVVDPGTARISRYSHRTKVQRLPIEAISQASANQRAGRCGRLGPGICIRLYSEEDLLGRPEFTEPEIRRTNLASVILQMAVLDLGELESFPFMDQPDSRNIKDGKDLLSELGAFASTGVGHQALTPIGRQLATLPLDPRLGRMVLEAQSRDCLREVMIIAAGLSIQDPRERPSDKAPEAAEKHGRFSDKDSDLMSYLNLWAYIIESQKELSSSQFRRMCRKELLNYLRVREWQDIYSQLRHSTHSLGLKISHEPATVDNIHISLLTGLLSHIGVREGEKLDFAGARSARFAIAPGSSLAKRPPRWVMVAELVETNRLWGRQAARIRPEWIERVGGHLLKRSFSEPHWDPDRGAVMAYERVTLYGVPVVSSRRISYGRVAPEASRDMFIEHALVERNWQTPHRFADENRRRLDEIRTLEGRARRHDLAIDDEAFFDLYDRIIPAEVVSARHFDSWWKQARRDYPDLLSFSDALLTRPQVGSVTIGGFPDVWRQSGLELPLRYEFDPGANSDGPSVVIPLQVLSRVQDRGFDWQVPGLREELVLSLLRSLPKDLRRAVIPMAETAAKFVERFGPEDGPLLEVLAGYVGELAGTPVPASSWRLERVPEHLRFTFVVEDSSGRPLASSKDLAALKQRLLLVARQAVVDTTRSMERSGETTWTFGTIPRSEERTWAGQRVLGYPGLVDEGDSVGLRVFTSVGRARREMWAGTRRLLGLRMPAATRHLQATLRNDTRLALAAAGDMAAVLGDCVCAALDELLATHGGPVWDSESFDALVAAVRPELSRTVVRTANTVGEIFAGARRIEDRLDAMTGTVPEAALRDIAVQLGRLVHPGFACVTGTGRLEQLPRYLQGMERRLDKLAAGAEQDAQRMQRVRLLEAELDSLVERTPAEAMPPEADRARWMIEELRISLFAQSLGTPEPVSEQRVRRLLQHEAWPHA